MPTRAGDGRGVGDAARVVAEHASTLARLELQLAAAEVKQKLTALGVGVGLVVGAGVVALFGFGFGLASAAAGIATALPMWAALLIVTGALLGLATLLGLLGVGAINRSTPPVPEQAIVEAKRTTEALRSNGSH